MRKLIALTLIAFAAGCAGEVATTDLDGLKSMRDDWQAAYDAGDPAAVASLYATDGAVLPPNGDAVKGRAAIESFWGEFMSTGLDGQISDTNVDASGDVGYKVGTYTMTADDGKVVDDGKYVEVWHRIDGRWQMKYDIFNSNRPLPAPAVEEPADDEAPVPDEE